MFARRLELTNTSNARPRRTKVSVKYLNMPHAQQCWRLARRTRSVTRVKREDANFCEQPNKPSQIFNIDDTPLKASSSSYETFSFPCLMAQRSYMRTRSFFGQLKDFHFHKSGTHAWAYKLILDGFPISSGAFQKTPKQHLSLSNFLVGGEKAWTWPRLGSFEIFFFFQDHPISFPEVGMRLLLFLRSWFCF